jgi:hypothetical protein
MLTRVLFIAIAACVVGCGPNEEPASVHLTVRAVSDGLRNCTNDLGFEVTLSRFSIALQNIEFTIDGETHTSLWRRGMELVLPPAWAHPGHLAGGSVTGELAGAWAAIWLPAPATTLGTAEMLVGDYQGANFAFTRAGASLGLDPTDPLLGHTAYLQGTARRDERSVRFDAVVDIEDGVKMVGATFRSPIDADTTGELGIQVFTSDALEGTTLFDGIDFFALAPADDGTLSISPGSAEHSYLKRELQVHDYYVVALEPGATP